MGNPKSPDLLVEGGATFNRAYRSLNLRERQRLSWATLMCRSTTSAGELAMQLGYTRRELSRAWLSLLFVPLVAFTSGMLVRIALDQRFDRIEVWQLFAPLGAVLGLGIRYLRLNRIRRQLSDRWSRREQTLAGSF